MSRAIPVLDAYERVVKGTDAQVVMLCANNYPPKLAGNFGIEGLFDFNHKVKEYTRRNKDRQGLSTVEISDDFWELGQLMFPDNILRERKHIERVEDLASDAGIYFAAMGTGALFSYAHVKRLGLAFFEYPGKGQEYYLKIYKAWADFAAALGIQIYTGRRPGTLNKENFEQKIRLGDISEYVRQASYIHIGDVNLGGIDPEIEITRSEALNLALALEMNRRSPGIMQLVEQMQYDGMEPTTVGQVMRFNKFLAANLPFGYFADMADNGHVGVKGTRTTDYPDDYNLFEYADAYLGPLLFIHHNILLDNKKQPGTKTNLERDQEARLGKIPAGDMPYPELIKDINDYLLRCLDNPNVKFIIASPEPTCDMKTDLDKLAKDVAEATLITSGRIESTGRFEESDFLPFAYITKGHKERLDGFLTGNMELYRPRR